MSPILKGDPTACPLHTAGLMLNIDLSVLEGVHGGRGRDNPVLIPEDGGIAGPAGSPTPRFPVLIPEKGGIAGPLGDPTPF